MHPRLYRLIETHHKIDRKLRSEQRRPRPDWLKVIQLKRLKLRAKELIHRFTRQTIRI